VSFIAIATTVGVRDNEPMSSECLLEWASILLRVWGFSCEMLRVGLVAMKGPSSVIWLDGRVAGQCESLVYSGGAGGRFVLEGG